MGVKIFKIILKQKEPIHIGRYIWRVLNETEIFIPGWTIWGALVNFFLLKEGEGINNEKVEKVKESLKCISNFFPTVKLDNNFQTLFPEYKNGVWGFSLKNDNNSIFIKEEEFRFNFVFADFRTSIEPILRKAKDEHLYEFEFIKPKGKLRKLNDENVDLYWSGFIILNENSELEHKAIENLQGKDLFIGGDTRYGFGRVEIIDIEEIKKERFDEHIGEYWNLEIVNKDNYKFGLKNKDNCKFRLKKNKPSRFFFEFKNGMEIEGELQIIPQLNFRQNTPIIEDAKFFARVGSKLINSNGLCFTLDKGRLLLSE